MIHRVLNWIILVLSLLLVVFISIDTFKNIDFLTDRTYMRFQLFVCVVFMADYFIEAILAPDHWRFMVRRLPFLLLSVPYLNIVDMLQLNLTADELYYVRFIPLARSALAMGIVVSYLSKNRVTSIFSTYTLLTLSIIYFGSLIFFEREHPVNPMVPDYATALYWAFMDATTAGCTINPVTPAGKVVSSVVAVMGMTMFPLFTVFITDFVSRHMPKLKIKN